MADGDWTFDTFAFDLQTCQLAGEKELRNYENFLKEYTEQLNGIEEALDDTLGEAWDFTLDPIGLQTTPYENASLKDLIRTDHKLLNKVVTVFSALCFEIAEHKQEAVKKFYIPLLMYGEGLNDGVGDQDGQSQLMIGNCIALLQDLTLFVNRINELVRNMILQLTSLYSYEGTLKVLNANGIHLLAIFEHIGDALAILITLDNIFDHIGLFKDHWTHYKRILTSVRGGGDDYSIDQSKLKRLEKLMLSIEGTLMDGKIFDVSRNNYFNSLYHINLDLHQSNI
jgi:WASH complex subunit 7